MWRIWLPNAVNATFDDAIGAIFRITSSYLSAYVPFWAKITRSD